MNREDMIAEAHDLELEFKGNISNVNLAAMLAEAKGEPAPLNEKPPAGPAVKAEEPPKPDDEVQEPASVVLARSKHAKRRAAISRAKKEAFQTKVVTLTNRDPRENDKVTTAYLSFENQHFGLSKSVPLDIPVELEVALIHIAETALMTIHRDEVKNGRRTGNKITGRVKKYSVSYSAQTLS